MLIEPIFWGSWKGQIIKAIVIDGAKTWQDLQYLTGLKSDELNTGLSELYDLDIITKRSETYSIKSQKIQDDYRIYFGLNSKIRNIFTEQGNEVHLGLSDNTKRMLLYYQKVRPEAANTVIHKVVKLAHSKDIDFNIFSEHFFITGGQLEGISHDTVSFSERKITVVNPFIKRCNICEILKNSAKEKNITMITRRPDSSKKTVYYNSLKNSGIQIYIHESIHAKIMVIDDFLAIVSSMNLYPGSTGGGSWEAGLITWEKKAVKATSKSINELLTDEETKLY